MEGSQDRRQQRSAIERECLNILYDKSVVGVTASLINALVLSFLLRLMIDKTILAVWLAAILLSALIRYSLIRRFSRIHVADDTIAKWRNRNIQSLLLSGVIWGTTAVFLFPLQSVAHQMLLAVVLCGMTAGAAMVLNIIPSAFAAYSIPAMLPFFIRALLIGDELRICLAVLTALFWLLSLFIAKNIRRTRLQLLTLKETLSRRVIQRTVALEKANQDLRLENQERKKIEEQLRQERDRLEAITAAVGAGLAVISRDGRIQWTNKVLKQLFGDSEGKSCGAIYGEPSNHYTDCRFEDIFEKGEQEVVHEQKAVDSKGKTIWLQIVITPIRDAHGKVTAALKLILPITERKKNQEERQRMVAQLLEARKAEAITTLAGGMAHQFNNALSVIVGNMELLQYDFGSNPQIKVYGDIIMTSARQMSRLTDQLLAYARGGKYKPQTVNPAVFFSAAVQTVKHHLKPDVDIQTDFEADLPSLKIDVAQMQMVISALLANAAEAIETRGAITIIGRRKNIHASQNSRYTTISPGLYTKITVQDNGVGMDEDTRQRIFEPFFSTKFQGRGLGMAAVYGIVSNHGGHITIESQPGQGARVHLFLPGMPVETPLPAEVTPPPPTVPAKGSGTVLLVEDEELVMDVNRAILQRLGYEVLEASTGQAALALIKQPEKHFDLVLLDIKLPDMDGAAVFPEIKKHRPQASVIICSGYALDGPTQTLMDAGADGFIHKPFSMSLISEKLHQVMALKHTTM